MFHNETKSAQGLTISNSSISSQSVKLKQAHIKQSHVSPKKILLEKLGHDFTMKVIIRKEERSQTRILS